MLAALTWRSGRIGWPPRAALAGTTAAFRAWPFGLQLLPLVLCENAADAQQETGIGLFQFGAGLRDLVDLSQDFGLVGGVGGHHRLHGDFFLLQIGVEVDQAQATLLEDVIHFFLLVGVEAELLDHLRVVPPAALRLEALHRRTSTAERRRSAVDAD